MSTPTSALTGALGRYRVMALVTGTFLLVLTTTTLIRYIGQAFDWESEGFLSVHTWIATVHGWIFVVYVIACTDVWVRWKAPLRRLAAMVLGGIVPVMSFVVERRVSREVAASLDA